MYDRLIIIMIISRIIKLFGFDYHFEAMRKQEVIASILTGADIVVVVVVAAGPVLQRLSQASNDSKLRK